MATAFDRGEGEGNDRPGGRKRRARRRAEAVAEAAITVPIGQPAEAAVPEAPAPAEAAAESLPIASVRKKERRRLIRRAAQRPQPTPEPEPVAVAPEQLDAETGDGFHDLLGQAIGLRLDAVSRDFDGGDMKVAALRDVSLEVAPGEFVAVIGPSGCGKTTLLSMMGGLDRPSSGKVYAAGTVLEQLSEPALSDYRLQRVATIFQTFNLVPAMSVEDNVSLPLVLAGVPRQERRERALHLLDLVGLRHKASTRAGRLSGGEKQKVAVARALANRPGLILADEPTGSLDSASGMRVIELLQDLTRRGATVVLVTHDPEVARHAKRVVRMIDGRAVELESGKPTMRSQEPVDPAPRMHWRDTLKVGLGGTGRRPLRTTLATAGVSIGIAALSLIVALAGGLQQALDAPALATSQVHQVAVYPVADAAGAGFDTATLSTLSSLPHVRAAWGLIGLGGTFTRAGAPPPGTTAPSPQAGQLVSLPPMSSSSALPSPAYGRLPARDSSSEILLTDSEAAALGYRSPLSAVGTTVNFTTVYGGLIPALARNEATKPVPITLLVSG